jgi:hypothetical protein
MMLCYTHGKYIGDNCPICGRIGQNSLFAELSEETQKVLNDMVEDFYQPDDETDLQELAAKAYLFGKED